MTAPRADTVRWRVGSRGDRAHTACPRATGAPQRAIVLGVLQPSGRVVSSLSSYFAVSVCFGCSVCAAVVKYIYRVSRAKQVLTSGRGLNCLTVTHVLPRCRRRSPMCSRMCAFSLRRRTHTILHIRAGDVSGLSLHATAVCTTAQAWALTAPDSTRHSTTTVIYITFFHSSVVYTRHTDCAHTPQSSQDAAQAHSSLLTAKPYLQSSTPPHAPFRPTPPHPLPYLPTSQHPLTPWRAAGRFARDQHLARLPTRAISPRSRREICAEA